MPIGPTLPNQTFYLHVEGNKFPVEHIKNILGKTVWVIPASGKGKTICEISLPQAPICTWWGMWEDGEVQYLPQRDLIVGEDSQ